MNYKEFSKFYIKNKNKLKHSWLEKYYPNILHDILNFSKKYDILLKERIYLFRNNLLEIPKCEICGNHVNFLGNSKGYNKICDDKKCISQKAKNNSLKGNFLKSNNIKENFKKILRSNSDILLLINNLILKNYCKHGDLKIQKIHILNKNLCYKCHKEKILNKEIIINEDPYIKEKYKNIKLINEKYTFYNFSDLYDQIINFSKEYLNISFKERIYLFINNIKKIPECIYCEKNLKFNCRRNHYHFSCLDKECLKKQRINQIKDIQNSRNLKLFKKIKEITGKDISNMERIPYYIIIKNYCKHGDLKEKISNIFNWSKTNKISLCKKCLDEYIYDFSNIQKLDKNEIINLYEKNPKGIFNKIIKIKYPGSYKDIIFKTQFIKNDNITERIYAIKNNLIEIPKCKSCNNLVNFNNSHICYNLTCGNSKCMNKCSNLEEEISLFLLELKIKFDKNRIIENREFDIVIDDFKLILEINGVYWHSDKFLDKNFHFTKKEIANKLGYNIIFIWEDDWVYKKNIVKSILINRLNKTPIKIFAKNTIIKELSSKECKSFLEENHIQGYIPSKINIGLFYNDELISLMTFGKRNISGNKTIELLRFCNKLNHLIIGGASKIFKYYIERYKENGDVISYSYLDYFSGNLYKNIGFEYNGFTGLNWWWMKNGKRYSRNKFQKYKLKLSLDEINKTGDEIMYNRGYLKNYGVGNNKWIYKTF